MNFDLLVKQHQALLTGRWITDLANTAAFIFHEVEKLNWIGFYLLEKETLYLGPFQGKPACTEIPLGKGVCGTAAMKRQTIIVPDVHKFEGHIACDSQSQSELVVPLLKNGEVIGVLDADSPYLNRFSQSEARLFEQLANQLVSSEASFDKGH